MSSSTMYSLLNIAGLPMHDILDNQMVRCIFHILSQLSTPPILPLYTPVASIGPIDILAFA